MYRGECNITHGGSKTRLYSIWKQMRIRCHCVTNPTYRYYGARGIDICEEWDDFAVFREWAMSHGYTDSMTIDRIDSNGDYCPKNCRWISHDENCKYKRSNKIYEHNGEKFTHNDWARKLGIAPSTLTQRIRNKGVEASLSTKK
ncbi:MAG: hypothetical protein ACI4F5_06425 [Acutalibacteraceae bacterium]